MIEPTKIFWGFIFLGGPGFRRVFQLILTAVRAPLSGTPYIGTWAVSYFGPTCGPFIFQGNIFPNKGALQKLSPRDILVKEIW